MSSQARTTERESSAGDGMEIVQLGDHFGVYETTTRDFGSDTRAGAERACLRASGAGR
ncbi:MAG TPA: hypothetical protein VNV39_18390 [Stellaceae bacterium]|nr:hypothetical protein [Stellaceae bacterium]